MTEQNTGNNTDKVDNKNTPVDEPKNTESMIPKTRFDQVVLQKNELNETLTGLVNELKNDIPEEYQDLIPDTKPADQIKWIRNAMKKGLFNKTETKSPDSKTPGSAKELDFSYMNTTEKIKHGYKK